MHTNCTIRGLRTENIFAVEKDAGDLGRPVIGFGALLGVGRCSAGGGHGSWSSGWCVPGDNGDGRVTRRQTTHGGRDLMHGSAGGGTSTGSRKGHHGSLGVSKPSGRDFPALRFGATTHLHVPTRASSSAACVHTHAHSRTVTGVRLPAPTGGGQGLESDDCSVTVDRVVPGESTTMHPLLSVISVSSTLSYWFLITPLTETVRVTVQCTR